MGQILHPLRTRSEQGWEKIPSNPSCCTCAPESCWHSQGTERGSTLSPPVASASGAAQSLPRGFGVPVEPLGKQLQGDVYISGVIACHLASPEKCPSLQELRFHCARNSSETDSHRSLPSSLSSVQPAVNTSLITQSGRPELQG